ncbi:MAG: Xaa-Pro peptidase family protein [Solirubrobacteraceae bacterium]|nr:Xaa-Pro peptidase family protein [Solirubrobacteraceae bacterium]
MSTSAAAHPTQERLAALRDRLPADGIAFVTDLIDVRWLTGLQSSNALVAVSADAAWLLTDFRYLTAADEAAVDGLEIRIGSDLLGAAAEIAKESGLPKVFLPKEKVTVGEDAKLADLLGDGIERVPSPRYVDALRAVKTEAEVTAIAAAQELADAAFREAILERGIIGRTEREVALDLEFTMRRLGAEAISFDSIIAAGAHGALPHAHPRDVAIPKGELVVIDWGAQLDGYCSDCTRTVATGPVDEKREQVHALVRAAQDASLSAIMPGASGRAVDELARTLIADAGHGDHFGHGLGHGVGLEVHEGPNLSPRSQSTLEVGHIVTVEPGVYLPGEFGVRVEELVAVTPIGPRILTSLPREAAAVS